MTRKYARKTSVPVSKTRAEIEKMLTDHGADTFMIGLEKKRAIIAFRMNGRHIKLQLDLPDPDGRNANQEIRRRWRSLGIIIKAKLIAVADQVSIFDDEWMPHIILPDNQTVGQFMRPQIKLAYEKGDMPALLPPPELKS